MSLRRTSLTNKRQCRRVHTETVLYAGEAWASRLHRDALVTSLGGREPGDAILGDGARMREKRAEKELEGGDFMSYET